MSTILFLIGLLLTVYAQTDFYAGDDDDGLYDGNYTAMGEFLGGPCKDSCNSKLNHVYCDEETLRCECDAQYPVKLGPTKGCAKPVNLGDQCFYLQSCLFMDENSHCVQISHNAVCQCKDGYHAVTLQRPTKRVFCSQDLVLLSSDASTLLGVATGLAIFSGLICFVLKLFVGSRPRHYGGTSNLSQPILFSTQTGHYYNTSMNVSVLRGGFTRFNSFQFERGSRGILVPPSRAASVHSSTSSTKSFSARQFERERENRLHRAREREKDVSPSPRSTENLLDGPHASESWPKSQTELCAENSSMIDPEALSHSGDLSPPEEEGAGTSGSCDVTAAEIQLAVPFIPSKDPSPTKEESANYHNVLCDPAGEEWSEKQ